MLDFEGHYEVSSYGRVRSVKNITNSKSGALLFIGSDVHGYPHVSLHKNNRRYGRAVHRIVAEAFLGRRPPGSEVNHKDGVKANSVLENIEYVSHGRNSSHAYETGLNRSGEQHERSTITADTARAIRAAYEAREGGYKNLGKRFGVSWNLVRKIVKYYSWRHI